MNADSNVLLLPLCFFGLYMILEAADWGLCLAAPLVSRNNDENRAILGLLKPGLDGNELWYFLGFFMMGAAVPEAMKNLSQTGSLALIVFIVAGALLRLAACVARNAGWKSNRGTAFAGTSRRAESSPSAQRSGRNRTMKIHDD